MNRSAVNPLRLAYPRASPIPATYSSPTTPTGTGSRRPSSTYKRVLRIGPPIGTAPSPDRGALIVAQTVVSVGPYALIIRRPTDQRATSDAGHASPATTSVDRGTSSGRSGNTTGGRVACVTPCVRISE